MEQMFVSGRTLARGVAITAACLGMASAVRAAPALAVTVAGENIYGSGSSLQGEAENGNFGPCGAAGWIGWVENWHCTPTDHSGLNNDPFVSYTVTSGDAGLAEFGNVGSSGCAPAALAGRLNPQCDPTAGGQLTPELDAFTGTDNPPTAPQLSNASAAAGAGVQELTIPVAQAPVAMLLSLPVGMTVGTGGSVKYPTAVLADLWNAAVPRSPSCPGSNGNSWCDLLEASGLSRITSGTPTASEFLDSTGDLGGSITRMAIVEGGGTTHAFQGFLWETNDPLYPLGLVAQDPSSWPVAVQDCTAPNACGTTTSNGSDAQLVANTTATPGSVGYADLGDAALASPGYSDKVQTVATGTAHQIVYAHVQDNQGASRIVYTSPSGSARGQVNVYAGTQLAINPSTCPQPRATALVGCWHVPSTTTGAWNGGDDTSAPGTFASDPDVYDHGARNGVGLKAYPIVAVAFAVAWSDYDNLASNLDKNNYYNDVGCPSATNCNTDAGNTTSSFLKYVTSVTGQGNLAAARVYYGALPPAIKTKAIADAKAITP